MKLIIKTLSMSLVVYGCHSTTAPTAEKPSAGAKIMQKAAAPPKKENPQLIFDVPALIDLDITKIKGKLGVPIKEEQSNADGTQRDCTFGKKNYLLVINYDVNTKKPDLFYLVNDKHSVTYITLLKAGNLDSTSSKYKATYSVEPVFKNYPGVVILTGDMLN